MIDKIFNFCPARHSRPFPTQRLTLLLLALLLSFQGSADEIFFDYPAPVHREMTYSSPTERFIAAHGWNRISTGLRDQGLSMVHRNFFDRISQREEVGLIGYHGSTQNYRLYQDIIRLILEEHVGLRVREDFHFFRIPGDPLFDYDSLEEYGDYNFNYSPTHFLCMNYALYGNFQSPACCSYYYFAKNGSQNDVDFASKLAWLFEKLGIDTQHIAEAYEIGEEHLSIAKGILIQVFDMSHYNPWNDYYALADAQCGGFSDAPISEIVAGTHAQTFPWQVRMLMSNRHTLNPYSSLVVQRYDTLKAEERSVYEQELRSFIRGLVSDPEKAKSYKAELLELWEVDSE